MTSSSTTTAVEAAATALKTSAAAMETAIRDRCSTVPGSYTTESIPPAITITTPIEASAIDEAAAIQVIRRIEAKAERTEERSAARQPIISIKIGIPCPARRESAVAVGRPISRILRCQIDIRLAKILRAQLTPAIEIVL